MLVWSMMVNSFETFRLFALINRIHEHYVYSIAMFVNENYFDSWCTLRSRALFECSIHILCLIQIINHN